MNSLRSYSGPAGLLMLASGAGIMYFLPENRLWGWILMSVGGVFALTYAWLNAEDLRNVLRGRAVRYGANAVFYSLAVLLIVAALNFLSSRHHKRFDLTVGGVHTLSPQTVKILEGLGKDVELVAFYTELNEQKRKFEDLTQEYAYHTSHLKTRMVDPLKSPAEARRYEIAQDGTVVVATEGGEARITNLGEEDLTNAILKATRKARKVVCFTTGHGEDSTADGKEQGYTSVAERLRKENYDLKDVLLLQAADVPADCAALVVAGPRTPLLPAEKESIAKYLASGGRVMVLKRDPRNDTGLDDLLAKYGLKVDSDVVVDRLSRAIVGDEFVPVVASYEQHPVTKELAESRVVSLFPVASSVESTSAAETGVTSQVIARTGDSAWGETDEKVASFDPATDHKGPVGLVAVASGKVQAPAGETAPAADANSPPAPAEKDRRLALFGDSDFASNSYLHLSGNTDLFLNTVAWLTEESDLISIRPKENAPQPVTLTAARQNFLTLMVYVTPLVTVVLGVFIWVRRKRL